MKVSKLNGRRRCPFHDLRNRYESAGTSSSLRNRLTDEKGVTGSSEHLVALNLSDGKMQSWNVPAESRDE